jgi:hypothetical protein
MDYCPQSFSSNSRARIEAERIRARRELQERQKKVPWSRYGPNSANEENFHEYILRVFAPFAEEVCDLALQGRLLVEQATREAEEFLRVFTIQAHADCGHDKDGRSLRQQVSNWDGSLLPDIQRKFHQSAQWHDFEGRLLDVIERTNEPRPNSALPKFSAKENSRAKLLLKELFPAAYEHDESPSRGSDSSLRNGLRAPLKSNSFKALIAMPGEDPMPVKVPGYPRPFSMRVKQQSSPKRRVSDAAKNFDKKVGRLMHEAHAKLRDSGTKPTRGRQTPNLPAKQFRLIVRRVDAAKKAGNQRFPIQKVLSKRVWERISQYNQKLGKSTGRLATWEAVAFRAEFKRQVRYRFNRAEIYYRSHEL